MLAQILAPAQLGITSQIISIECDISNGLPAFIVVGLADKAVDEAKERVRAALRHSKLPTPAKRITMNLAPANLPKDGTGFDLGMAIALLCATGHIFTDCTTKLFAGELSLDGSLRPIRAVLAHAQAAKQQGIKELYIPTDNAPEAALCKNITIYPVTDLRQLYLHLTHHEPIKPYVSSVRLKPSATLPEVDFAIVRGQTQSKRALEIAAAGGHNILMTGPPGSGKTMLARAMAGILPPLSFEELVEVNQIHSVAGLTTSGLITARPFRNPHHTASAISLIGGGRIPRPGEISLGHHGVLFLDELPEFPRPVLEVLRQPLEDGRVTISRAQGTEVYPAQFMLVATQNPCPCGYFGDPDHNCTCRKTVRRNYVQRVSGPLLDRIDLHVEVAAVSTTELTSLPTGQPSSLLAKNVAQVRAISHKRLASKSRTNASLTNAEIAKYCIMTPAATMHARLAAKSFSLSARGYMRLLRVSRTIADIDGQAIIDQGHVGEALQYRRRPIE